VSLGCPTLLPPNYLMLTCSELFQILRWQITINWRRTCYTQSDALPVLGAKAMSAAERTRRHRAWIASAGGGRPLQGNGPPISSHNSTAALLAPARSSVYPLADFPQIFWNFLEEMHPTEGERPRRRIRRAPTDRAARFIDDRSHSVSGRFSISTTRGQHHVPSSTLSASCVTRKHRAAWR
jgi:hypothetical protein